LTGFGRRHLSHVEISSPRRGSVKAFLAFFDSGEALCALHLKLNEYGIVQFSLYIEGEIGRIGGQDRVNYLPDMPGTGRKIRVL
jgi:hypothetical protein